MGAEEAARDGEGQKGTKAPHHAGWHNPAAIPAWSRGGTRSTKQTPAQGDLPGVAGKMATAASLQQQGRLGWGEETTTQQLHPCPDYTSSTRPGLIAFLSVCLGRPGRAEEDAAQGRGRRVRTGLGISRCMGSREVGGQARGAPEAPAWHGGLWVGWQGMHCPSTEKQGCCSSQRQRDCRAPACPSWPQPRAISCWLPCSCTLVQR